MSTHSASSTQKSHISQYVPWSTEKKKSVIMYLGIGIVLSLSRDTMSSFEYFHLKQALGWWIVFVLIFVLALIVMFLPLIWFIWRLLLVVMLGLVWLFVKQAWDGIYYDPIDTSILPIFVGMWWWMLQMFDMQIHIPDKDDIASPTQSE